MINLRIKNIVEKYLKNKQRKDLQLLPQRKLRILLVQNFKKDFNHIFYY